MLKLQISRGHVSLIFERTERFGAMLLVVLVDNSQAKRSQKCGLKGLVQRMRMAFCNQAHLLCEPKVKVSDFTERQFLYGIFHDGLGNLMTKGVSAVDLRKGAILLVPGLNFWLHSFERSSHSRIPLKFLSGAHAWSFNF